MKLRLFKGSHADGSPCFFILRDPDPEMTYEGIPQEARVVATAVTSELAHLIEASPDLLTFAKQAVDYIASLSPSATTCDLVVDGQFAVAKALGKLKP